MSNMRRVSVHKAVGSGVITRGVHGVRASLVEGGLCCESATDYSNDSRIDSLTGNLTSRVVKPVIFTIVVV